MLSLRRMEQRLKFCCFREGEKSLLRSILGIDCELLPTMDASVRRAWPDAAARLSQLELFRRTGWMRRDACNRVRRAFSLSDAEWKMLCRIESFYSTLAAYFPDRSYAGVYARAYRFRRGRNSRSKIAVSGQTSLSLTMLQVRVADLLIGFNGQSPSDGIFAVTKKIFCRAKTNQEVKAAWWNIKYAHQMIYNKIEKSWRLSDEEYKALIVADSWHLKLSRAFPNRTPETLSAIKRCLFRKATTKTRNDGNGFSALPWRNILEYYRHEIMKFPEMSDDLIKEYAPHLNNGDFEKREKLFHLGLRDILPVAYAWYFERVVRETGFDVMDLIQEGSIALWLTLCDFNGESRKSFREFAVQRAREGIKTALRQAGMSIRISKELTSRIRNITIAWNKLYERLRREPNAKEISVFLDLPVADIEDTFRMMKVSVSANISLDALISDSDGGEASFYHIIPDHTALPPDKEIEKKACEIRNDWIIKSVEQSLQTLLSPVEQYIISKRFGFQTEAETIEVIAAELKIEEYFIQKIEDKALVKIRSHPEVIEHIKRFAFWCGH